MPSHHHNPKDSENPDERALIGHPKADALPVDDLSAATDDQLGQEALDAGQRHPNRGHDKPSIDKPSIDKPAYD